MEKKLTTGSVFKTVVQFSFPYLLSYFLQTLYGMADLFIIGQFNGVESTTAVSIGSQVMHMLTVMIVGLAMGATVMIGRAIGAQKQQQAARAIGNIITLFMVVSILLTAGLLLAVEPIAAVMSTPAEAISGTVSYLTICFIGIPFIKVRCILSPLPASPISSSISSSSAAASWTQRARHWGQRCLRRSASLSPWLLSQIGKPEYH